MKTTKLLAAVGSGVAIMAGAMMMTTAPLSQMTSQPLK